MMKMGYIALRTHVNNKYGSVNKINIPLIDYAPNTDVSMKFRPGERSRH